jgi:hypothetical protein
LKESSIDYTSLYSQDTKHVFIRFKSLEDTEKAKELLKSNFKDITVDKSTDPRIENELKEVLR